jgi:hypothetical protein
MANDTFVSFNLKPHGVEQVVDNAVDINGDGRLDKVTRQEVKVDGLKVRTGTAPQPNEYSPADLKKYFGITSLEGGQRFYRYSVHVALPEGGFAKPDQNGWIKRSGVGAQIDGQPVAIGQRRTIQLNGPRSNHQNGVLLRIDGDHVQPSQDLDQAIAALRNPTIEVGAYRLYKREGGGTPVEVIGSSRGAPADMFVIDGAGVLVAPQLY